MERVLLIRGGQKMHPTLSSFEDSKEFWFARGWRVASDDEIKAITNTKELIEKISDDTEDQESTVLVEEKPSKKKKKNTEHDSLDQQLDSDTQ